MDRRNNKKPKEPFNTAPGFFGQVLDHEAPIIVCDCMAFIRNKGLYDVGVFRVSGSQDVVNVLKQRYNEEFNDSVAKESKQTSILNNHDPTPTVNDIASLLKAFFKDLSEPLIPVKATEAMVAAVRQNEDEEDQVRELSKVVKSIPSPNRECLGFLISFLREICTFKKFNQMSAENLATCFVLSMMGGSDAFDQLYLLGNGAIVIKKLITKSVSLYMPSVQNVKKNTKYKDVSAVKNPPATSSGSPDNASGASSKKAAPSIPQSPNLSMGSGKKASTTDVLDDVLSSKPPDVAKRPPRRPRRHDGLPEPVRMQTNANNGFNPLTAPPPMPPAANMGRPEGTPPRGTNYTHGSEDDKSGWKPRSKKGGAQNKQKNVKSRNPQPIDAFPAFSPGDSGMNTKANNLGNGDERKDEPFPELAPPNTARAKANGDAFPENPDF